MVVAYSINKEIYLKEDYTHQIFLSTTEYTCGTDMLVLLQINDRLGKGINARIEALVKDDKVFQTRHFMFKKTYQDGDPRPITATVFEKKFNAFQMDQTKVEQEIIESYCYKDKKSCPCEIKIVIASKDNEMNAIIDFNNQEQHRNFVKPLWLI